MLNDLSHVNVKCPTCGKQGAWFATPFGPFCSQRCKMVDLGKWLGEEHTISEPLRPEHFEPYGDLPSERSLDRSDNTQDPRQSDRPHAP